MNNKKWILLVPIVILLVGAILFFYNQNTTSSQKDNYEAQKTSTNDTSNQMNENNQTSYHSSKKEEKQGITEAEQASSPKTEEEIAVFTTRIYSSDPARQNNINLTCNTLNGTLVKNRETFSFCSTVGQASTSKGYQKADIFDKNGNKKKGLGGRELPN